MVVSPVPAHAAPYAALVSMHAVLASASVAAGFAALAARKGGPGHRRAGRAYWRLIAGVAASGAALMLAGAWSVRLLVLLALTAQTTWSGVRVLRRRRPDVVPSDRATRVDLAVAALACTVGVAACAAAAAGVEPQHATVVWSTAPLLALYAGYDLWRFARPAAWPMRPRLWLGEHVVKMTGAYFGAASTFAGSALARHALGGVPQAWRVVVPNVVGVLVAAWFLARMRRRRAVRAPATVLIRA